MDQRDQKVLSEVLNRLEAGDKTTNREPLRGEVGIPAKLCPAGGRIERSSLLV
jgi:hypothetical protein